MKKIFALSIMALSIFAMNSTTAFALDAPRAGTSKANVESKYGAPEKKSTAVGQPPISNWVYPEFTVYFEFDHVIHAVAKSADKKQTK